jgi:hypothetical protein
MNNGIASVRAAMLPIFLMIVFTSVLSAQQPSKAKSQPLIIEKQGSFFVGGRDIHSETLSTQPNFPPVGTITVDQMYVHYQIPANAKGHPITLLHGCCLTGKTWETTPDGRMGWDEYFVRKHHATYVIDQASRGRSASDPSLVDNVKLGNAPAEKLPDLFAASHEAAWTVFRFGPEYPKVFPGMQFPLEAQTEFWKQMVPDWSASLPVPNPTVPALSELAIRLNGTVLVSHSQSGIYPFQTAALTTKGIAGIVALEPGACPSATADMKPYVDLPILVVFGDYVDLSARWAPRLKACREFVQAANKAGGKVELVMLPEIGFRGSSHMFMQDRNSLEIADWLLAWIDSHIDQAP